MIFCSKTIPKSHAIILLRKVGQCPKNIWEFSQIFGSKKNEGYFGAQVSELNFREEIEYFSFMKNIPWPILGFFRERRLNERWMAHLGENQGHAQVFKSIWIDSKTPNSKQKQMKSGKREKAKTRLSQSPCVSLALKKELLLHEQINQ